VGSWTLGEIAARLGGRLHGDPRGRVTGIRSLAEAGPDDLSFVSRPDHRDEAARSRAGALLAADAGPFAGRNVIVVPNPYAALAEVMDLFHPPASPEPGISPQALVGEDCDLGVDVSIGPFAVVGRRCVLGARVALRPRVVLGDDVRIGADTVLHAGVVVYPRTVIGERVTVHANSVLGSDGFGYAEAGGSRRKIPQVGDVVLGDDVEIGACVTIDRATFGSTVIGARTKIDNQVQIGHNVQIGEDCVLVAQVGVAGSTRLGRGSICAGQSGVSGHLTIGEGARIGAATAVLQDLPAGAFVLGAPAQDHRDWKKQQAALRRLPDLLHRVGRIERTAITAANGAARGTRRPARGRARRHGGGQ
jgi:UDP-3-O-[3-hydroxymyristoyl] glucosamine N-acyltransferase